MVKSEMSKETKGILIGAVLVLAALGVFALLGGNLKFGAASITGGTEDAQITNVVGICPEGDINMQTAALESIADDTGVRSQLAGTLDVYLEGTTIPFDSVTTSTTVFVSTSPDPPCGSRIFSVFSAAGYYDTKTNVQTLPTAVNTQYNITADRIATISVLGKNATNMGVASGMKVQVADSETSTTNYLNVQAATPRGVIRKPAICFSYNEAEFSSVSIIGGQKIEIPSGICSGADEAWVIGTDRVENYGSVDAQIKIAAANTVNPDSNVTATIIDYGTYQKATNGILYNGYQNGDTHADVGATNVNFTIDVD